MTARGESDERRPPSRREPAVAEVAEDVGRLVQHQRQRVGALRHLLRRALGHVVGDRGGHDDHLHLERARHHRLVHFLRGPHLRDAMARLGLVHEVVDPDALMTRALELARELADGPQVAMRLLKRSIYNAAELTFAHALDEIAAKTAVSDHHPDAVEGMRAFA